MNKESDQKIAQEKIMEILSKLPNKEHAQSLRQWPTLKQLISHLVQFQSEFTSALLVGSFAAGNADTVSDIDFILLAPDDKFDQIWKQRDGLHVTGSVSHYDELRENTLGAHKWLTPDIIFMECLIATLSSNFHLAEPYIV